MISKGKKEKKKEEGTVPSPIKELKKKKQNLIILGYINLNILRERGIIFQVNVFCSLLRLCCVIPPVDFLSFLVRLLVTDVLNN